MKRGPDWHVILRGVERWSLAPLVYTSLRQADPTGQVPDPVKERLRHLYRRQTIHWIDQREVLRETLQRFSDASVPAIVLKGAALATLVYPSPALQTDEESRSAGPTTRCSPGRSAPQKHERCARVGGSGGPRRAFRSLASEPQAHVSARRTHAHLDPSSLLQTGCQPLIFRSRVSGSGRDPPRSSWWPHWCSAPRTFSCTSPSILRLPADSWAMPGRFAISDKRAGDTGMRSIGVKLLRRHVPTRS